MENKLKSLMASMNPGDIVLVRGDNFVAKGIRFFMRILKSKLGVTTGPVFNHSGTIVSYKEKLYVVEANKDGIEAAPFAERYGGRLGKICIQTPNKAYSKKEQELITEVALSNVFQPTRYDFFSLWYQIKMIFKTKNKDLISRPWEGPTGDKATNRMYCTEASATWANAVRKNTFKDPWSVNPLHIMLNKYYKTLYNGVEEN